MKKLAILSLLFLVSCSVAKPLNDAVTTAERLVYYYDGDITSLLQTADLSQSELNTVSNAIQTANRIRMQFERYKSDPTSIPTNMRILQIEYNRLKNAYTSVREIAITHQETYDPNVWATFEIFDLFAQDLDVKFDELVSSAKTNEALINTLSLANSILRIAVLL